MRGNATLFILFQMIWTVGFSQSLQLPENWGEHFRRANLDVRWEATNVLPHTVWIYRVLPKAFQPEGISNLVLQCGFTESNIIKSNADFVVYAIPGKFGITHPSKQLQISRGCIFFINQTHYGPTNLATDVPEMNQMLRVTTNFLTTIGLNIAKIEKKSDGTPKFEFIEPFKEYCLPNGTFVTNVEFREVGFGRSVDGAKVLGAAGYGDIYFGEHGKPIHIDVSWQYFERFKSCPAATPEIIIKWIREGKAMQGGIPMNQPPINWATVKSLTIKEANLCYYAGDRLAPSGWLTPLVSFWTTVDTGQGNVDVEIDCPIIDETRL